MQNSLERLFEGLENTLRNIVAPTITDSYILTQITSVAEIIGNLSTRVEWSCAELRELSLRVRPVLELAAASTGDGLPLTRALLVDTPPTTTTSNAELVVARDRHLLALQEVQRSLESRADDVVEAAIREFLGWQVAHEATLLRTGMFSAPKK
jgi:hypothetical protein